MYETISKLLSQTVSGVFRLNDRNVYVVGKDNALLAILDDKGIRSYFLDASGTTAQENALIGFYKVYVKTRRFFSLADLATANLERKDEYIYRVRLRVGGTELDLDASDQRVELLIHQHNPSRLINHLQGVAETIALGLCSASSVRFGKLAQETIEKAHKLLESVQMPGSKYKPFKYPLFDLHGAKVSYAQALDQLCADALDELQWLRDRLGSDRSYASGLNLIIPSDRESINSVNASSDYIEEEFDTATKYLNATLRHLEETRSGYELLTT